MLRDLLTKCVKASTGGNVETMKVNGIDNYSNYDLFVTFIVLILYIFLILLIGRFLWNAVLCRLVTIVKPVESIWQVLGLVILLNLIYGF